MTKRAEVILTMGRQHLVIRGLVVATEGDLCRDSELPRKWTGAMPKRVRDLINDEAEPVTPTRDAAKFYECTADPVFLFQARRWTVLGCPEGYDFDDEGDCVATEDALSDDPRTLSPEELSQFRFGDHDTPCSIETWETERVYLSREAGEEYGTRRSYNYRAGWRVYCVPAAGALAVLLNEHGESYWPKAAP